MCRVHITCLNFYSTFSISKVDLGWHSQPNICSGAAKWQGWKYLLTIIILNLEGWYGYSVGEVGATGANTNKVIHY